MDEYTAFTERLRDLISGRDRTARAAELAHEYWSGGYPGRNLYLTADHDHPEEISERDILAMTALDVAIPAPVTAWLLGDEGRTKVATLLGAVPVDVAIRDAGDCLDPDRELSSLWNLLATVGGQEPRGGIRMDATRISTLLAAKRPLLVPIYDEAVERLLPPVPSYWRAFQQALEDDELAVLLSIFSAGGAPESVGLLRRVQAMLWMIARDRAR